MDLEYSIREGNCGLVRYSVIEFGKEINFSHLDALRTLLDIQIEDKNLFIVLDLEKVRILYSVHVGVLFAAAKKIDKLKGKLAFINTKPQIITTLNVMGMTSYFDFYESEEEVIETWEKLDGGDIPDPIS